MMMTTPFPLKATSTLPRFLLYSNSKHNRVHYTKFHRSPVSRHFHILPLRRIPNFKALGEMNSDEAELRSDWFVEPEDSDLPVEMCYTRTLPPALTLNTGISKIEEELLEIKSNPPNSKSGILRIQVPIPPGAKASSWFCSHPQSTGVFPQFYFSQNNLDNPHLDSHSFSGGPGVSGIGASVHFTGCSTTSGEWKSIERYLSLDSPLIRAYGFTGIYFDKEATSFKHEAGSFYVFIPQIELVESGGISLLAATLAWDDGSICTFLEATHSLEFFLSQASRKDSDDKCINSVLGESNLLEDNNVEMVIITAKSIEKKDSGVLHLQPVFPLS